MTEPLEPFYGPPPPQPPRRRGGGPLPLILVAVLAAAAGAGVVVGLNGGPGPGSPAATAPSSSSGGGTASRPAVPGAASIPSPASGSAPAATGALNAQAVADKVEPGVVNISAPQAYSQSESEGTGIILTSSGLVMTNNHVIEGATSPAATLVSGSGKTYKATILGYDATDDVALLQLAGASGLTPAPVGNSDWVKSGMKVLGLGNAQGQGGQPTVAPGEVSALNQTISPQDSSTGSSETLHGTIQTTAQIQPGDSGGPLASATGQVVGMDVAASQSQDLGGTVTTAGYAIPINTALQIARQIAGGQASATVQVGLPSFMGISVADAASGCPDGSGGGGSGSGSGGDGGLGGLGGSGSSGGSSGSSGSQGPDGPGPGALVCSVYSGTPAATASLSVGDVITTADGQSVTTADALISITAKLAPGQSLSLGYTDGTGAARTLTLTLIGGPAK